MKLLTLPRLNAPHLQYIDEGTLSELISSTIFDVASFQDDIFEGVGICRLYERLCIRLLEAYMYITQATSESWRSCLINCALTSPS